MANLLALPTELLDNVLGYLVPARSERRAGPKWIQEPIDIEDLHDDDLDDPDPVALRAEWQADLRAVRLTCNQLAAAQIVIAALFHEFHLYVSEQSLTRLRMLSLHDGLRPLVRRIVFMRPQAPDLYLDPHHFEKLLRAQVGEKINFDFETNNFFGTDSENEYSDAESEDAGSDAPSDDYDLEDVDSSDGEEREEPQFDDHVEEAIKRYMRKNFPQQEIVRCLARYKSVNGEERALLDHGVYMTEAVLSLSRFEGIASIILCGGDGSSPPTVPVRNDWDPEDSGVSWLKHNHPSIGLATALPGSVHHIIEDLRPSQNKVFSILSIAQIRVTSLAFSQDMMWGPGSFTTMFQGHKSHPHLANLQELRLVLDTRIQGWKPPVWRKGLKAVLASAKASLRVLYLGANHENEGLKPEMQQSHGVYTRFEVEFERLEEIHLSAFGSISKQLAQFVSKHDSIRILELVLSIDHDKAGWRNLFNTIRDHPSISEVSIRDFKLWGSGPEVNVSIAVPTDDNNVFGTELYNYVHKKGPGGGLWTDQLKRMFGDIN